MSADSLTADGAPVVLARPTGPSGYYTAESFTTVGPDEVVVAYAYSATSTSGAPAADQVVLEGYSLDGSSLFTTDLDDNSPLLLAGQPGHAMLAAYAYTGHLFQTFTASGDEVGSQIEANGSSTTNFTPEAVFASPTGFHVEWVTNDQAAGTFTTWQEDFTAAGQPIASTLSSTPGGAIIAYGATTIGASSFVVSGDQAQLAGSAPVTLPTGADNAVTDVVTAGLAGGTSAAVAWVDSGTAYAAVFDAKTDTFGPVVGLDWGGVSDLHLVALPDGGFAVSWVESSTYKGEVFDASGNGVQMLWSAGQFAGIDSQGDLYTVAREGAQYQVQAYTIGGAGSSGGTSGGTSGGDSGSGSGSEVYTSDPTYTAPDGVTTIHLTGSNQTVTANNAGDVIWSDNTVNHLIGGTGDDVFYLGRGGDIATGGGGADTFAYAEVPWAAGQITDFGVGDVIDLTGLLHQAGYSGNDPVGAHYLDISPTISGAELQVSALGQLWEIAIVDGVSAADLQVNGDLITLGASGAGGPVTTSASNYVAPANVTSITLTGSQQHIDASAVSTGVTINSNDTGNTLIGGSGNDVFHLGRGGDVVTGGTGADDFMYAQTPWAGGVITDFNPAQADRIDVSGLLQASGYAGSDPFADGYLKYTTDSAGNAQLWSDVHQPGNDGWWLVATLDGVSTSSLHYANGLIT